MRQIDSTYQVIYAELAQRALDSAFMSDFPVSGRFVPVEVKTRKYWYFDEPNGKGGQARRYVGPADDPDIAERVERFADLKQDARARRKLVSTLVREAYLPQPDRMTGDIVETLGQAGFFRLRGVLVGTVAYQTYAGLLGVRLAQASLQTGDADFAQFRAVSAASGDSLPTVLEILRQVDASFRAIPDRTDSRQVTAYVARNGFRVEFLTPNTGSDDHQGRPTRMPALGGASATPLRFLDFLIHEPVRAILLHRSGVPVLVPAPQRYVVHKLIVAARRRAEDQASGKHRKDLHQAIQLADALATVRRADDLAEAWLEARERGPHWRDTLKKAVGMLSEEENARLHDILRTGFDQLGITPPDRLD